MDGPGGEWRIDPGTQHAYKIPRVGRIKEDGQFEIVWQAEASVAPEPYPSSRSAADWRAALHDLYRGWNQQWAAPAE